MPWDDNIPRGAEFARNDTLHYKTPNLCYSPLGVTTDKPKIFGQLLKSTIFRSIPKIKSEFSSIIVRISRGDDEMKLFLLVAAIFLVILLFLSLLDIISLSSKREKKTSGKRKAR